MTSTAKDFKKLASDSVLVLVAKLLLLGGSFLTHTLLVRNLEPGVFGQFSLAVTVVTISGGIAAVGMRHTVARFISIRTTNNASEYITIGITTVVFVGTVLLISIYLGRTTLDSLLSSPGLSDLLQVLVILVLLRPLADVVEGTIRGYERTSWKILYGDVVPLVGAFVVFVYVLQNGNAILAGIAFYVLKSLLKIVAGTVRLKTWTAFEYTLSIPSKKTVTETLSFSWPLAVESLVVIFLGSIDILMLGWLTASEEIGLYKSIQPVANILTFLLGSLTFIYLPIATRYFSDGRLGDLDIIYKTSTRWISQLTFPLLLFYFLFGENFLQVLFGSEYAVAWSALVILSVGQYSSVITGPNGMTIKAIDRTREDLLASGGALITNVVMNYLLIPIYGIEGAAVATTLGFLVYNIIDLAILYWYVDVSPFHWDLVKPIPITVVAVVGLNVLVQFPMDSLAVLFATGIVITVIHLGSIAVTTGLTDEDKVLLKQVLAGMN
jgi:O-antigen/teichoic acid export membrane protein